jgi:hypothetical protein
VFTVNNYHPYFFNIMAYLSNVRIKCVLQLMSGLSTPGVTRQISMDGLFMECHSMDPPKIGESGMITLNLIQSNQAVSVKASCRISGVYPDGMEISAQFAYMTKPEVQLLKKALEQETDEID